jgi:hypothetical protein
MKRNLGNSVSRLVGTSINCSINGSNFNSTYYLVMESIRSSVWHSVSFSVYDSVSVPVSESVWTPIRISIRDRV